MRLPNDVCDRQDRNNWTASNSRKLGFLAVPLKALRDLGQAAKTLAAIINVLRMDGRKTFRSQSAIAKIAGISTRTFRRHIKTLEAAGIIRVSRREDDTSVIELTGTEADLMADGFIPIPRYVLDRSWSQAVVLGWLVYRAELSMDEATCEDSLGRISKAVGLTRRSIINAVGDLAGSGYIVRESHLAGENGRFQLLMPPCLSSQNVGGEIVSAPREGGEIVSAPQPASGEIVSGGGGEIMSDRKRRVKKRIYGPKKAVDQKLIPAKTLAPKAAGIFKDIGYSGNEGRNLWKIAAAAELGLLSENELADSIAGCRECQPRNRPAYFYQILANHLRKRGTELREVLAKLIITPNCPTSPPTQPSRRDTGSPDAASRTDGPTLVSNLIGRLKGLDDAAA